MKWKLTVHVCKILSIGLTPLQKLKIQLEEPLGKGESVDSYLSVWLATGQEDGGLRPQPSHSALLRGDATLTSHMVVPGGLPAGPNAAPSTVTECI